MEGNLRFKIDWANLIVRSKFTIFALFYFVFVCNFPSTSPQGAYIWTGDLTEGFFPTSLGGLYLEGLIFGILRYVTLSSLSSVFPFTILLLQFITNMAIFTLHHVAFVPT